MSRQCQFGWPNDPISRIRLEVCIDSLESAINAIRGGAHEIEVCSSLTEGGLTPSAGLITEVIKKVNEIHNEVAEESIEHHEKSQITKINVMIRCRGGADFCYTEHEISTMLADIALFKEMPIDRFVFGALTDDKEVDVDTCLRVISAASPIPLTFHRAFDLCGNPEISIQKLVNLGFDRLLTSGQQGSAVELNAVDLIRRLHQKYSDKIEIMPGSGVNSGNVAVFVAMGCTIVHSSCKKRRSGGYVTNDLGMGSTEMFVTDENIVRDMVRSITNCKGTS
ncbi:copper homeostasis protein cutC homolog [Leptidea sinapis]|uniref:copper homeostasis protein cutC homolog n=1 Tax=Leptidea sinapis TaxID=189913 RepID=UPI00213D7DC7|nr:copper homeostasis protein cutC homolog [Leptidea sinapis]